MAKVEDLDMLLEAHAHVLNQTSNFKKSASLKCAIELGIPDVINKHGKPITLSELISALPIHPSKANYVYRLMRFLVNGGFFIQQDQCYALTTAGRLLLKDEPVDVTGLVALSTDPIMMMPWIFLTEWFKNDDPSPFATAHGKSFWDYTAQEPRFGKVFYEAMANGDNLPIEVLTTKCKFVFEGLTSLTDVGGGTGKVAKAIAKNFPNLKCIVCDLPHVVANQEGTENLDFVSGDMLEKVPPANAVLLKLVLHNWSDEDCLKILKNCKIAIPTRDQGGKVIIIDVIIESQREDNELVETQIGMDMHMLVLCGAKERTEKEWATLFLNAGFSSYKVFPVFGARCLIEVYP